MEDKDIYNALRCPICLSKIDFNKGENYFYCNSSICKKVEQKFISVNGKPVLIDFAKSILSRDIFRKAEGESVVKRGKNEIINKIKLFFQGQSLITKRNIEIIISQLNHLNDPRILIVGGGEIGSGLDKLYDIYSKNILSIDIYDSDSVDFVADGHQIPIKSSHFDLVVCQAVLEHVINPSLVASEITRVLKMGGLIYAETPFMQQIHEGPFDFTRFSESGHRLLFKNFSVIKSGFTAGAGSALIWSLSYFIAGIFRSRLAGRVSRVFFFWLRFFDGLIPYSHNIDAACGIYFLGEKDSAPIPNNSIINYYQGAQKLK